MGMRQVRKLVYFGQRKEKRRRNKQFLGEFKDVFSTGFPQFQRNT